MKNRKRGKRPRAKQRPGGPKGPRLSHLPAESVKDPRLSPERESAEFRWRTKYADLSESEWGWGLVPIDEFLMNIAPKLHELEQSTWAQIIGQDLVHFISPSEIAREARDRLMELVDGGRIPEDLVGEDMASIRFTGRRRLWGFKQGNVCHVLWWDPNHTVYPVEKRHT